MAAVGAKKTHSGKFTSTALSTGGQFYSKTKGEAIVVDKAHCQRNLKLAPGSKGNLNSFDMFKPLNPNSEGVGAGVKKAGQNMHSDPFAENRPHFQPPVKKLIAQEKVERKEGGRSHIRSAVQDGQYKEKVITANGLVAGGGKGFNRDNCSSRTTFDTEEKKAAVDYSKMARFRNNASKALHSAASPISPNVKADQGEKEFPVQKEQKVVLHTKRVAGAPDNSKSLVGVLKMESKRPARSYNYRPPWGTCNTPRSAIPASRSGSHAAATPWASEAPAMSGATTPGSVSVRSQASAAIGSQA